MKILIVDDNFSLTTLLSKALSQLGYEAISENNASNAIATIQKDQPDLIILDLEMPEKNGLEIYGELRLNPENASIPVVMMVGVGAADCFTPDAYGCDVIAKPAKFEELIALIDKNLNQDVQLTRELDPVASTSQKREVYENVLR